MSEDDVSVKERWARFRLQVIGALLATPPGPGELQTVIRDLSEWVYRHPLKRGISIRLGLSTIECWYYQARDVADPVSTLRRKLRSEAGERSALSEAVVSALSIQYQQFIYSPREYVYQVLSARHQKSICLLRFVLQHLTSGAGSSRVKFSFTAPGHCKIINTQSS